MMERVEIEPLQPGVTRITRRDAEGCTGLVIGSQWVVVTPGGVVVRTAMDPGEALEGVLRVLKRIAVSMGRVN